MKQNYLHGWTLVESLVVMAIVSVLASIALPRWQTFIGKTRIQSAADLLTHSVTHARSEAIRRGNVVVIQRYDTCVHRNWSCGWFTFEDANGNNRHDKDEFVIKTFDPPEGVLVTTNASGLRQRMRLTPGGASQGVSAASFFVQLPSGEQCTRLLVSAGLRWRTETC
jgi:type IV fimbrial biogenesis protein FimT